MNSIKMNQKRSVLCCVPPCKGEHFDLAHKFPRSNERCKQWLDAIGCPKLKQIPMEKLSRMFQVCSRHFRVEDYKHAQARSLNMTAIPSLNLKHLNELHLSKAYDPLKDKSSQFVEVLDLIGELPRRDETENVLSGAPMDREVVHANTYKCVKIIPIEDSEETLFADSPKLDIDHPDKESIKSDRFETFFEVTHPAYDNKLSLNSFWLRCHCRCSMCYDPIKRRKKINFMDIPSQIQPKSVEHTDDMSGLTFEWDDGHKSQYDITFLFNSQVVKEPDTFQRVPWYKNSDDIQEYTPIEFNALVSFDENIDVIFHSLSQHGVAIIENIPTQSNAMAKLALCRLFPHLQTTHFEEVNEIHSDISTNLTYSSADCGLKCFFTLENVDITLVDGLNVAHELRALDASAFKTLSQVKIPLQISDDNLKWNITAPVIEVDPETEEILHFRLDVHRMGVFNTLPQEKVEDFYDSLREMIKIIQTQETQWVVASKPGTMVILDNSRVFHKVCGSSGIFQCCLDRKDYVSRLRYLGSTAIFSIKSSFKKYF